ncbi:hypothetical protein E2320_000106, partial [Naja naja]
AAPHPTPRKALGSWSAGRGRAVLTLEANVEGDAREGRVDDVAQVHLLLFVEVEFSATPAGVAERDELLRVEPVEGLQGEEGDGGAAAGPAGPARLPVLGVGGAGGLLPGAGGRLHPGGRDGVAGAGPPPDPGGHGRALGPGAAAGWPGGAWVSPGDVAHVVCTHGHSDHAGNLNLFPRAELIVGTDVCQPGGRYLPTGLRRGAPYAIHAGTWSDVSLLVLGTALGNVVVAGDLFEHQDDEGEWAALSEDPARQAESRARVLAVADVIVPGHGPPFHVLREGAGGGVQ